MTDFIICDLMVILFIILDNKVRSVCSHPHFLIVCPRGLILLQHSRHHHNNVQKPTVKSEMSDPPTST